MAEAMGSKILPYLDLTLTSIKEGLSIKGRARNGFEVQIFQCISSLSIAVGPALTKHMHEILDFMFSGGISSSLVQALVDLSAYIPPLSNTIQGFLSI